MAATITNFISALHTPSNYLKTLFEARVVQGENVRRTTEFAEATILWHSKRYLLSMPLTTQALRSAQRSAVMLRTLRSSRLGELSVLSDEMEYFDSRHELCRCDLLLQELAAGGPLCDCIEGLVAQDLFRSLDRLEAEFKRLSLSLPNLKAENIIVAADGELYPTRLQYATMDSEASAEEFAALRQYISATLHVAEQPYESCESGALQPQNALYGYKSVGNPFEGMCVAESRHGYGYISDRGEEIIPPTYLWAGDMREGRAEVETEQGMGLIDAQGNYIIEPRYQIVEFDARTGLSRVKLDDEWSWLDYEGREVVR